jgi:hypothetical protein
MSATPQEDIFQEETQFAFEGMKIEIITKDKVPNTDAKIIMDEGHSGNRIGFTAYMMRKSLFLPK